MLTSKTMLILVTQVETVKVRMTRGRHRQPTMAKDLDLMVISQVSTLAFSISIIQIVFLF